MRGQAGRAGPGRGRWALLALLALLGFLAGFALALQRRALAESLLELRLRQAGLEDASLAVSRLDWGVLELRRLRGAAGHLAADLVEARYSLAGLRRGRLEELRVRGLRLRGTLDQDGASFGALDGLLADAPGTRSAPLPERLALEDARLTLATPGGALESSLRAEASEGPEGRVQGWAEFSARHDALRAAGRLDVAGPADSLTGNLSLKLSGDPSFGEARLSGVRFSLEARIASAGERIELRPTGCTELGIEAFEIPGVLSLARPVRQCLDFGAEPALALWRSEAAGLGLEARVGVLSFPFALTAGEALPVEGYVPELRLRLRTGGEQGAARLQLEAEGGRLRAGDPGIEARGFVAAVEMDPRARLPEGRLRVTEILDAAGGPRAIPLALEADLRPEADHLVFGFELRDAERQLHVEGTGTHDPRGSAGKAEVRLHPLRFEATGRQPAQLLPVVGGLISNASGAVEALGSLRWGPAGSSSVVDVALRDLGGAAELADFERLNGAIRLQGPWPLSTPPAQLVSMASVDFGLELEDGLVSFEIQPDGFLEIDRAQWSFAGGRITTAARLDPAAEEQQLLLELEDLDLGALLELVNLQGLSGEGNLAGEIPIVHRRGSIEIVDAFLVAAEPGGRISYRPGERVTGLGTTIPDFELLLAALEDFHYQTLEVELSGDAAGSVQVVVRLRGSNPALEGGRPVEFNLDLEAELGDLLGVGLASYRIPEEVEARLREFSERLR